MHQQIIKGPQGKLAVSIDQAGSATPAIFIHSDLGNRHHWESALAHLRGSRPVLAFDRRGHGESSPPKDGAFGYAEEGHDIAAVADELGFEQFVLIGHSGGGAIAFHFANSHPVRVAGLLLVDAAPDPAAMPKDQRKEMLDGVRTDPRKSATDYFRAIAGPGRAIVDRIIRDLETTPTATIVSVTRASFRFDPSAIAGRFKGPGFALIQSQSDGPNALHRLGPGMAHQSIDGVGHWIQLGAPDRFEAALEKFLETVDHPAMA